MRGKKGFTLIELMVVLVMLAILAAITVPMVSGYVGRSEQNARNSRAHTLFLVAQEALNNMAATGRLDEIDSRPVPGSSELSYVSVKASQINREGSGLITLLAPYVSGYGVLDGTILVEFKTETGIVTAVFYSDVVGGMSYGGAEGYDVTKRSEATLKAGRVGYCG